MKFLQRAITHVKVGQTRPKSNLTCIMSRQIHIWNFNSICLTMTKKSAENEIFAKGNNSCKRRSNATKVKLDLYYVTTNPYTKFQVNISKDDWEKFGKPSGRTPSGLTDWRTDWLTDWLTDGRTEWQTARKPIVPPGFTGRGLINYYKKLGNYHHTKFSLFRLLSGRDRSQGGPCICVPATYFTCICICNVNCSKLEK